MCVHTPPCTHSPCSAARGPEVQCWQHGGSPLQPPAAPLPWSKPVRTREKVMKARWALPRWESSGVAAVMKPQAEADSRMTFSPPILHGAQEGSGGELCGRAAGRTRRPYRGGTRGGGRRHPSLGAALWGGHCSHIPSAEEAEAERAGYSLALCPHGPQSCLGGCRLLPREPSTQDELSASPSPPLRGPRVSQPPSCCGWGLPPIPFLGATSPSPAAGGGVTGPPGGHPPPESGSSPRRSC